MLYNSSILRLTHQILMSVEYLIHLLRLRFLHHLPIGINIQQIQEKLESYFQDNQLQTSHQIQNIIKHICNLVQSKNRESMV